MPPDYVIPAVVAILTSILIGLFAGQIALKFDLFDHPDGTRKLHGQPTPLVGGFMVFSGIGAVVVVVVLQGEWLSLGPTILLVVTALALLVGLTDDVKHVRPVIRLMVLSAIAASAMIVEPAFVVRFLHSGVFGFHQGLGVLALPLSVLAFLAFVNALNMIDGMDGLFGSIALIYLALLAPWAMAAAPEIVPLLLAMVGAVLGILIFNVRGQVFMGDSGTYAVAAFVALAAIFTYSESAARLPGELIALWFGVPIFDMIRLFAQRVRAGRSPFSPDRNHLHHLLQSFLPDWAVVAVISALVGIPGLMVALEPSLLPFGIAIGLIGYIAVTVIGHRKRRARECCIALVHNAESEPKSESLSPSAVPQRSCPDLEVSEAFPRR